MTELAEKSRPLIGVGVMVFKDGKVLIGKRKSEMGRGSYIFPGGHLEYMESFDSCVRREVLEESGLDSKAIYLPARVYNLKEYDPKHYIDLSFAADWVSGEPKVLEPEKNESWRWYDLENLPSPLFAGMSSTIESYKTGKNYYES